MPQRSRRRPPTRAIPRSRRADALAWPSFYRPLRARSAAAGAPRPCRPTRASSSMTAGIAANCCVPSRATAACSALTGTSLARRFRKRRRAAAPHHAAAEPVPPDSQSAGPRPGSGDWVNSWPSLPSFGLLRPVSCWWRIGPLWQASLSRNRGSGKKMMSVRPVTTAASARLNAGQ